MPNFNFDIKYIVNNVCRLDDHISGNLLGKHVHCGVTHLLPKEIIPELQKRFTSYIKREFPQRQLTFDTSFKKSGIYLLASLTLEATVANSVFAVDITMVYNTITKVNTITVVFLK